MKRFEKRMFRGPGQFLRELAFLLRHGWALARLLRGKDLDTRFRERLFLAVTQVNRCRTCTWAHTRIALQAGIAAEEVRALLEAELDAVPEQEREAVLYAQHWADADGAPEPEVLARVAARYGAETLARMHLAMRFIRFCNYSGNLTEYLLFLLSFGRLGGEPVSEPAKPA
ncbi:MAG: carboxymuconolactone decarboxylase family protein [Candidatus Hydrogenedentes bacterium]|nr:carboxymuconolactone decarboxylase family protein [Candidatus Hydrogenedentota bacterium]